PLLVSSCVLSRPPRPTPFPYTTLFRSGQGAEHAHLHRPEVRPACEHIGDGHDCSAADSCPCSSPGPPSSPRASSLSLRPRPARADRKSTRLNSSHVSISYAVFCLKTKT